MKQILTLPTDLLTILNKYSEFIINNRPDQNLPNWKTKGKFMKEDIDLKSNMNDILKDVFSESQN